MRILRPDIWAESLVRWETEDLVNRRGCLSLWIIVLRDEGMAGAFILVSRMHKPSWVTS